MAAAKARSTLPQGSLDMLILRTLATGAQHGYAIAKHLSSASRTFIQVEEGSLYPALHRLERRGWVASKWGPSETNRRAKFYQLTAKGKRQLEAETAAWKKMTQAVDHVLNFRPAEV